MGGEGAAICSAMFPECLLCAGHHSRHWTNSSEQIKSLTSGSPHSNGENHSSQINQNGYNEKDTRNTIEKKKKLEQSEGTDKDGETFHRI